MSEIIEFSLFKYFCHIFPWLVINKDHSTQVMNSKICLKLRYFKFLPKYASSIWKVRQTDCEVENIQLIFIAKDPPSYGSARKNTMDIWYPNFMWRSAEYLHQVTSMTDFFGWDCETVKNLHRGFETYKHSLN